MESIVRQLIHLGCTPREARIYVEAHSSGTSTIQSLPTRLGENRVTVHSAVERLLEKGFLSESREGRRRSLQAEPPEQLQHLLERKRSELLTQEHHLRSLTELLLQLPRKQSGDPTIRLYRGIPGLKRLLEETLSAKTEIRVMIDISQFVSLLSPEYLKAYYEERARRGVRSMIIWPKNKFLSQIQPNLHRYRMEVRLNNASLGWKAGMFCWDSKIGIKSLAEGSLTCTILESSEISSFFQRYMFDPLWKQLPAPEGQKRRRKNQSERSSKKPA